GRDPGTTWARIMNASCTSPSAAFPSARPSDASRRVERGEHRQGGDDFERLLRDKVAARDDEGDRRDGAALIEAGMGGAPAGVPPFPVPLAAMPKEAAAATTASA